MNTSEKRLAVLRERFQAPSPGPYQTVWIIQPENRRYLSGFKAEDTLFTESSGSLFITQNRSLLVTDSRYTVEAETEAKEFEVTTVRKGLVQDLPRIMERLEEGVMGFEQGYVSWGLHREMTEKLAELGNFLTLEPLNDMVEEMRAVKDPGELGALDASARIISGILDQLIPWLTPGMSELEVAWRIGEMARDSGADGLAFPAIVASGPNAALPHAVPTRRRFRTGEPIVIDVGVKWNGYCSDMTRTVFLGGPSSEFRTIYWTVRQAQLAAMAEIRAGVESTHPDAVARRMIADAGYGDYFGHSLGHGVGLAAHERPRLSPQQPTRLQEGMVVTVEPGIYLPGKGGVRLEEMVVVEEGGARVLTTNTHFYEG